MLAANFFGIQSQERVDQVGLVGRIGGNTTNLDKSVTGIACLFQQFPPGGLHGALIFGIHGPAGQFQNNFLRAMTVLPDQHHFLLLCQRDNGDPIPVLEHKPVNDHPIGKFAFINANVFVYVVRFQYFPGYDSHVNSNP